MDGIVDAVQSLLEFPLMNVVMLIMTLSIAFWLIKLRPAEQEKTNKAIENLSGALDEIKVMILGDKTNVKGSMSGNSEALARNSEVLKETRQMLKELKQYLDSFNSNCARLDDVLDGILETQGAILAQYTKVFDEITSLRLSYELIRERLSDIKKS